MKDLDSVLGRIVSASAWLVLPLSVLLVAQWPLRDLVRAHSREANDLGQVVFALYVAVAVTAATRRGVHVAADLLARHYSDRRRRWLLALGLAGGILPWGIFVLATGSALVWTSLLQREAFADTLNPGYFLIKFAMAGMVVLLLAQALLDLVALVRGRRPGAG